MFKSTIDKKGRRCEQANKYSKKYRGREPGLQYGTHGKEVCSKCGTRIKHDVLRFSLKLDTGYWHQMKFRLCPLCIRSMAVEVEDEIPKQEAWIIKLMSEKI